MKKKLLIPILITNFIGIAMPLVSCESKQNIIEPTETSQTAVNELEYGVIPVSSAVFSGFRFNGIDISKLTFSAKYKDIKYANYNLFATPINVENDKFDLRIYSIDIEMPANEYQILLTVEGNGKTYINESEYIIKYETEFLVPNKALNPWIGSMATDAQSRYFISFSELYLCHEPSVGWETPMFEISSECPEDVKPIALSGNLQLYDYGTYKVNDLVAPKTSIPTAGEWKTKIRFTCGKDISTNWLDLTINVGPMLGCGSSDRTQSVNYSSDPQHLHYSKQYPARWINKSEDDDYSKLKCYGYDITGEYSFNMDIEWNISDERFDVSFAFNQELVIEGDKYIHFSIFPVYNQHFVPNCEANFFQLHIIKD